MATMEANTTAEPIVNTTESLTEQMVDLSNNEIAESVTRYVVVNVNGNLYGMATHSTVELMSSSMTQVTRVPHSPKFIRGVINHRGTIIPVIDARSLLGFQRRGQEASQLQEIFAGLKADHDTWLNAVEQSIKEGTPFTGPTDPTQCRFGVWYGQVMDGTVAQCKEQLCDSVINAIIKRFDTPHRRMHTVADHAIKLAEEGNKDKALSLISESRDRDLGAMNELFDHTYNAINKQYESMLVITEHGGQKAAIAVDGVSFVADCKDELVESLPDTADNTEFLSGLVHRPDGSYILIADLGNIYSTACVTN